MKKMLREAGVSEDEAMIAVTSDKKSRGSRFMDTLTDGAVLIVIGIFLIIGFFYLVRFSVGGHLMNAFASIFVDEETAKSNAQSLAVFNTLTLFVGILAVSTIIIGMREQKEKATWHLIVYQDQLLYKYRENEETKELTLPLAHIQSCYMRPSQKTTYGVSDSGPLIQKLTFMNMYIEYEKDDTTHYIHLPLTNRYSELNTILSYLQSEYHVSIYATDLSMSVEDSYKAFDPTQKEDYYQVDFDGKIQDYA